MLKTVNIIRIYKIILKNINYNSPEIITLRVSYFGKVYFYF